MSYITPAPLTPPSSDRPGGYTVYSQDSYTNHPKVHKSSAIQKLVEVNEIVRYDIFPGFMQYLIIYPFDFHGSVPLYSFDRLHATVPLLVSHCYNIAWAVF